MTFNTGNPVPSTDPRDLYDNAENLDKLVNGADPFYADRKGKLRQSWAGMEDDFDTAQAGRENTFTLSQADKESRFQAFLVSSGYVSRGDYAANVVLEKRNEYVAVDAATTGTTAGLYRPNAAATLPLTLTGTWATDSANLVLLGDDVLRQELAGHGGAGSVGFDDSLNFEPQTVGSVLRNSTRGIIYVESFRTSSLSDSNTIRAALDWIEANRAGVMTRLVFEAGRTYVYDRTAELRTINNLVIDLNGATLKRAPASATKTTLAQDAGTGQSTIFLASIPDNWEVGDYLAAYTDNTDAGISHNICRIESIVPAQNRVGITVGFGHFGGYTDIIPAGTTVAKKFSAFAGRPSTTEAGIPTPGGVNANVHIINGVIDGNAANQENNSWYFNSEIVLHGRQSSIREIVFVQTAGECIVGHGLRVEGNTFRGLKGSAFHLSRHDDTWAQGSASWFVNNFVNGVCQATQEVNAHSEGAITFSWGAGRLIVAHNEFWNGVESILGAFASNDTNPDEWLIFSGNLCRNFDRLFFALAAPEGVVVTDNILVDCESAIFQMSELLASATNSVGGNVCIGNSAVAGAYRATHGVFGSASQTITQLKLLAGEDVSGFDITRLVENKAALMGETNVYQAFVTSDTGRGGLAFYSPSGSPAGDFFAAWNPATKSFELLGNAIGGGERVAIRGAFLSLPDTIQTYADNAAARSGGLLTGDVYQTPTGQLMRVY